MEEVLLALAPAAPIIALILLIGWVEWLDHKYPDRDDD
ncbi:hypothetical protein LMG26411_06935 [Cupriavidus numazuensis]|uniref:Uncharacterized protein n=1 Tax=Cupriavidus numazuensis TaxID=221992 RepID=A0ABN7QC90_9BURK|nr:hypothetical protein LMG26411_06935 [Cupriavidus numazuensis]